MAEALHSSFVRFDLFCRKANNVFKTLSISNLRKSPNAVSKGLWSTIAVLTVLLLISLVPRKSVDKRAYDDPSLHYSSRDILVLYIFSDADPMYMDNMKFFIKEAVEQDDRSEFIFLIEADEAKVLVLPPLPAHAKYLVHGSECFDWGIYGTVLNNGSTNVSKYRYTFLINCSVRGPFIPPLLYGFFPWWYPFVSKLVGDVKMVGSTVSCEGSPLHGDMNGLWRRNPHVQSFAMAMDKVALQLLLNDKNVFTCHNDIWDTVYHSELGASSVVLQAGYNLDSMMLRYQGVDWRDKHTWECNSRFSPNGEFYNDGLTLDPFEAVFVKIRTFLVEQQVSSAIMADKYTQWIGDGNVSAVTSNDYLKNPNKHRVPKILMKIAHGQKCFDARYYLLKNPDLAPFGSDINLWKHFVYYGQFEPRQHRFKCPFDYTRYAAFG